MVKIKNQKTYKLVNLSYFTMIVELDKLGRIVLRKKIRERYGEQFIVVPRKDEIALKPLTLEMDDLAEKLDEYSVLDLKKIAEEEALKEAEKSLK